MYRTILVPIDGSPAAMAGLDEAIRIASHSKALLELMNVIDDMAFSSDSEGATASGDLRAVVRERGEKVLRRARDRAEAKGVMASTALVRSGTERMPALVARRAEESGADLIVVGTHGHRGLSRLLMGTESEHLFNLVTVPVLLVRSTDVGPDLSVVEMSAADSMFHPGLDVGASPA